MRRDITKSARLELVLIVALLLVLAACGGGSSSASQPQAIAVSVVAGSSSVSVGGMEKFTAMVTGTSNIAVTWAVQESNGGTIDSAGNYTAPMKAGNFHVIATSQADSSKSGTAGVAVTAPAPVFASTPPTASLQDTLYSYAVSATDPAGTAVTLSLTTAPAGAQLNSGTVTWTPIFSQSRAPNALTVTATSAAGGTATQSWTLSPNGTVFGHYFLHFWGNGSEIIVPQRDFSVPPIERNPGTLLVWVPQADGTLTTITGIGFADGTFQFPGVPAGNYIVSLDGHPDQLLGRWENTSTLYFDGDINGFPPLSIAQAFPEALVINVDGFDPAVFATDLFDLYDRDGGWEFASLLFDGETSFTFSIPSLLQNAPSVTDRFVAVDDEGAPGTAPFTSEVMGPSWVQPFSQISDGTTATFEGEMTRTTPGTLDLNVAFSTFANAFASAGPGSSIPSRFDQLATSEVKVPKTKLSDPQMDGVIPFFAHASIEGPVNPGDPDPWPKDANGNDTWPADQSYGTLTYSNPFATSQNPAEKTVYINSAGASFSIPVPGSATPLPWTTFLSYAVTTPPSGPISVLMPPPANGSADGVSFATGGTINSPTPTLQWDAPTSVTATAKDVLFYQIQICELQSSGGGGKGGGGGGVSCNLVSFTDSYPTNSYVVPAGLLQPGQSYIFDVNAVSERDLDLTNPHRFSYPLVTAEVVSAAFTVAGRATAAGQSTAMQRAEHRAQVNSAPQLPIFAQVLNGKHKLVMYREPVGTNPPILQQQVGAQK